MDLPALPESDPVEPRWRRRKQARPAEIAAAALDLFVERGFAATRLDDVAARAGVSKGTLYLYFDSKEALLKQAINEMLLPNVTRVEEMVAGHTGPTIDLIRMMTGILQEMLALPITRLPKLMLAEAANFPDVARHLFDHGIDRFQAIHRAIIARGIERGEFRPVDVEWAAQFIQSQFLFLALWTHALGPVIEKPINIELYVNNLVDFLVTGLQAQPPPNLETFT